MKKRTYFMLSIIPLSIITVLFLSLLIHNRHKDDTSFYALYVKDKLDLPFELTNVEISSYTAAFSDQSISLKARVVGNCTHVASVLYNKGWKTSSLPEEFWTEGILDTEDLFDMELTKYYNNFDCMWFYRDDYFNLYNAKGAIAGRGTNCLFRSPNYTFTLFVPKYGLLFYKEYDS